MTTDENPPTPAQPAAYEPFQEQPVQPSWNTGSEDFGASGPPLGQSQPFSPQGYDPAPGLNQTGGIGDTTLPPRVGSPNSVPLYGMLDPTTGQFTPSQPITPYGAPPSLPMYGSSPQWLAAGPASVPLTSPATKKSRVPAKSVTIVASVLVILAIAGGGLAFVSAQNRAAHLAASKAADALCAHLVSKDYSSVYTDMSSAAQVQYSSSQFGQLMTTLDQLEGVITSCHQAAGAYSYQSGSNTASTTLDISRATLGVLTGTLTLQKDTGTWKSSMLGTDLLGVNPGALSAVETYCSALQSQQYSNLDSFLGSGNAVQMTSSDFEVNLKLQDLFDGSVSDCQITQIGTGNTDSTSTLTLSITRTKSHPESGHITLTGSGGSWDLSAADPSFVGTDYRPVLVGENFCTDLQNNDLGSAYKLFDSGFQHSYSLSAFETDFDESGWSYFCSDPDMSTFSSSSGTASYNVDLVANGRDSYHLSGTQVMTLQFANEAGTWYIDGYDTVNK